MEKTKTKSELLFEELLEKRGFEFEKGEDFFKEGEKCPDYYVVTKYGDIICEVKEFNEPEIHKMMMKEKVRTFSYKQILNPIKNKINNASKQLKPYEKYKIPLIVILSNPYNFFVDLSDEKILSAMFGEIGISIPLNNGKEDNWFFGRNGILTNQKEYISAVCVLEYFPIESNELKEIILRVKDRYKNEELNFNLAYKLASEYLKEVEALKKKGWIIKEEKELRLRVFHNFRTHLKFPIKIFNSKYDENYMFDKEKNSYLLQ